jgi:hypothetical protein
MPDEPRIRLRVDGELAFVRTGHPEPIAPSRVRVPDARIAQPREGFAHVEDVRVSRLDLDDHVARRLALPRVHVEAEAKQAGRASRSPARQLADDTVVRAVAERMDRRDVEVRDASEEAGVQRTCGLCTRARGGTRTGQTRPWRPGQRPCADERREYRSSSAASSGGQDHAEPASAAD